MSVAEVSARIQERLAHVTAEQYNSGLFWYQNAREYITATAQSGNMTGRQVAGIMAALSPQTRWAANVIGTTRVVAAKRNKKGIPPGCTLYKTNARKAWRIASGAEPGDVLGGQKVLAFYQNLTGNEYVVTVDTWAFRGSGLPGTLSKRKHAEITEAYRMAASQLGLKPAECQAIDWCVIRGKGD